MVPEIKRLSVLACVLIKYCTSIDVDLRKGNMRISAASPAFADFIQEHGRTYRRGSREYEMRRALFEQRMAELELHNGRPNRLWTAGINHLTDRTDEELAQLRGWRGGATPRHGSTVGDNSGYQKHAMLSSLSHRIYDESISWDHLNVTNSIADQGPCGSCWAIAGATVLAAHSEIYKPEMERTFSAQQLVSCVRNPHHCGGTGACDGATVELAFDYVMRHGLVDASTMPYMAERTHCEHLASTSLLDAPVPQQSIEDLISPGKHMATASMPGTSLGLRGWARLPENKYEPLMHAIASFGPVAVSADARKWSPYESGIFDDCNKNAVIDHAVTLIGYGQADDIRKKYWLIQNSWGAGWGERGKIKLLRQDNDEVEQCGVDRQPELGTGCDGGPREVRVCGMCGVLYDNVVPYFS